MVTLQPKLSPRIDPLASVPRSDLVQLLAASTHKPVVSVLGPPGYGKTTLLAQWAEHDERPFGWLTVDHRDNDPAVLLRNIAIALDRSLLIDEELLAALTDPGTPVVEAALPWLGAALATAPEPFVLVLDDLHLVQSWDCLDALCRLIDYLPANAQLVAASRGEPQLPLARLRAEGRLVEVGPGELAMDDREASSLLERAEVDLAKGDVDELVRRTEGWPVALRFAALSRRAAAGRHAEPVAFTGDDRFLADYLQVAVLSWLPPRLVTFLTRCAVLDRMSGPLCDAVAGGTGSADLLESLERSNLLLVPLDRRRRWYRFHPLFRELLAAELERREPELVAELHRRAAAWWEGNDRPMAAVEHAMAADDPDQAARLVAGVAVGGYVVAAPPCLQRWFAWFDARELAERYDAVAVLGAWLSATAGRPVAAERWAKVAEGRFEGATPDRGPAADGTFALVRAALCRNGVERMRADAKAALPRVPGGSASQATAQLLLGISLLLAGDEDAADRSLADATEVGEGADADSAVAALSERALLAIERGAWPEAETLAERARSTARDGRPGQGVAGALLHAVTARLAIHRGDVQQARAALARAEELRRGLTYALPHLAVQVRLELARDHLALMDMAAARRALGEADAVLSRRPQLGVLRHKADELRGQLDAVRMDVVGGSSLTPAEVRLLRLLGTHYTFREIGQQLYLSQHTVKSQAMSIYRKFGVSSRSEAIQRAGDLGLLT